MHISDKINHDKCVGCRACTKDVCFVDVIHMVNGKPIITDHCRGCGCCVEIYPQGAIELHIEDKKFIEETIKRISEVVNVT